MSDPATYRPASGSIPTQPGVYKFRDPQGRVVFTAQGLTGCEAGVPVAEDT